MEVVTALGQLINEVGLPAFFVCALLYLWNREIEAHKEEVAGLTEAVKNNTAVMSEILGVLRIGNDGN